METKHISVINGREKGGSTSKIKEAVQPNMLDKLVKGFHMFLDNLSGDIFTYDKEKQEWQPYGNVGLHYSRDEASIQGGLIGGAGDLMKGKKQETSVFSSHKPVMIMTSDSDIKCELRKNFVNHWCVKKMYHEFIAENINTWDPHPINITNMESVIKPYTVIADGKRGA